MQKFHQIFNPLDQPKPCVNHKRTSAIFTEKPILLQNSDFYTPKNSLNSLLDKQESTSLINAF